MAASAFHASRSISRLSLLASSKSVRAFSVLGSFGLAFMNPNSVDGMLNSAVAIRMHAFHQRAIHALRADSMEARVSGSVVRASSCSMTCAGESGSMPVRGQTRVRHFIRIFANWSAGSTDSSESNASRCAEASCSMRSRISRAAARFLSPPTLCMRTTPSSPVLISNRLVACCAFGTASNNFGNTAFIRSRYPINTR